MKKINFTHYVRFTFSGITLVACIFGSFVQIDAEQNKSQKPRAEKHRRTQKPVQQGHVVETVVSNNYSKSVSEAPLDASSHVQKSVVEQEKQLPDGSVELTKITTEPMPQEGKVVTTTERLIWYGKLALGALAIGGLGYFAWANADPIKDQFNQSYDWLMCKETLAERTFKAEQDVLDSIKLNDEQQAKLSFRDITSARNCRKY